MLRIFAAIIIVFVGLSASPGVELFQNYPAEVLQIRKIAKPLIVGDAKRYRTRIREGMQDGAVFAGRYAFIEIGNGTMGSHGFIVNVQNGKVFRIPLAPLGYEFRLNSNLLVINPKSPELEGFLAETHPTEYWVWDGKTFEQIDVPASCDNVALECTEHGNDGSHPSYLDTPHSIDEHTLDEIEDYWKAHPEQAPEAYKRLLKQ